MVRCALPKKHLTPVVAVIGQGQGGAQVCGMIRNAYYNFFMCFKFSGCYQTILGECDQIVWSVNYNLVQTVNNDYYNGLDPNGPSATTNPYNCTLPTSCNELFGYPTVDGSFQIDTTNTSPATTATLSRLIALVGLAVASTAALM
jgi:hypothetical protein